MKLIENGVKHEEEVVSDIPYVKVSEEGSLNERAKETKKLMDKQTPWVYQGVLLKGDMVGVPDLLEWVKDHYEPIEIKSGRRIKKEYALQLCFYSHLLGEVTGKRPSSARVINIDKEKIDVDCGKWRTEYEKEIKYLKKIVTGKESDELAIGSVCNDCPWRKFCENEAKKKDDLTLIHNLGRANKFKLKAAGINTQREAAAMDISSLAKIKGLGPASLIKLKEQAEVNLAKEVRIIKKPQIREAPIEIYIDLEGDPMIGVDYLIGLLIRQNKKEEYIKFIARQPEDEGKMWKEFLDFMSGIKDDYILYHYHGYEKSHFKIMFERHGGDEQLYHEIDFLLEDLLKKINGSVVLPLMKYSLKYVARYLDFEWCAGEEAGGANSILWYQNYLEDPKNNKDLLEKIIEYNADDCRATRVVKDWLCAL